jgi:hypothetical protein
MSFYGLANEEEYARIMFIVFAAIAAILGSVSLLFLQKLIILPVFLLPLLCFCVCFENVLLSLGSTISSTSDLAYAGNVFSSLKVPLFVTILHETSFRLYQSRSFQFCCIRFNQNNSTIYSYAAIFSLWSMRLVACGLFVMSILANFLFVPSDRQCDVAGRGGYVSFVKDPECLTLILSLFPYMFLSFTSIMVGLILVR